MKVVTQHNTKEPEFFDPVIEMQSSELSERLRLAFNKFFELKYKDDDYSATLNTLSHAVLNQSRSNGLLLAIISHLCDVNEENHKYVTTLLDFYEKEVIRRSLFNATNQRSKKQARV
jgi:hypothetical protein